MKNKKNEENEEKENKLNKFGFSTYLEHVVKTDSSQGLVSRIHELRTTLGAS